LGNCLKSAISERLPISELILEDLVKPKPINKGSGIESADVKIILARFYFSSRALPAPKLSARLIYLIDPRGLTKMLDH
jgi:hypothetical protein